MELFLRKTLYGGNENLPKPKNFSLNRGQMYPEKLNYMDYRFDEVETWWPWLKSEDCTFPADTMVSELMVPTKENGCIMYWANHCVNNGIPMLLVGQTGTGKSATLLNFLKELPRDKFIMNTINFSARTSAQQVQDLVMSKLDRRRKGVFGPPVGKNVRLKLLFLKIRIMKIFFFISSALFLWMMLQCLHVSSMDHRDLWSC